MNKLSIIAIIALALNAQAYSDKTKNVDDGARSQVSFQANSNKPNGPKIQDGDTIAYAYMENGDKLIEIKAVFTDPKNDKIEVIKITRGGFFPNYIVNENMSKHGIGCSPDNDNDKTKTWGDITKHCNSTYFTTDATDAAITVVGTVLVTAFSLGINVATGTYIVAKSFDKDKFLDIVEKNKLVEVRENLLELERYEVELTRKIEKESTLLYSERKNEYEKNAKNISIEYSLNDKSGLYKGDKIIGTHSLDLKVPPVKSYRYNYRSYLKNTSFSQDNYLSVFENVKQNMLKQYEDDTLDYKNSVDKQFEYYTVLGKSEWYLNYNQNISFFVTAEAPNKVFYTQDKQVIVNIPITIEYTNLNGMIPKSFKLSDENYELSVTPNYNLSVTAISKNKTKSYITTKSITSYYSGLVCNNLDLNRELAPDVVSLPSNSTYTAISQEQKNKSNFSKINKERAKEYMIDYGYAVKYRINNTNIDKSIYQTKQISLYDIYQQYL